MKKYLFLIILFVGVFIFNGNDVLAAECSDFGAGVACSDAGCFSYDGKCISKRENFCGNLNENECDTPGVAASCCEWFDDVPFAFMERCRANAYAIPGCIYSNTPTIPTGSCSSLSSKYYLCLMRSDCIFMPYNPTDFTMGGTCESKYAAPSISTEADLSGVSFNNSIVSGMFKAGVQKVNNVCSSFSFTSVTYKIDNGSEKTLNCWKSNGSVGCTSNLEISKPIARAKEIFNSILSIFRSPKQLLGLLDENDDGGGGGGGTSCSTCTVNQYQFDSGCSISTSGLSSGSHTLNLIFKTNSSVKSSYIKSFTIGSTAECDTTQNNNNNSNNACVTKYGIPKICCRNINESSPGPGYCDRCSGGSGPTPTPTPILTPTPTPPPVVLVQELSFVFSGQNVTKSGKAGAKITASPGDLIKYSVKVTSTGKNEVKNTLVKASIPGKIVFQDGSLTVDGQRMSGDFFGRGLDIGTLVAGQSKTVSFETKVVTQSQFAPNSQETLTSSVMVQGVGVMAKTGSVSLTVGAGKVVSEMSLDMNARNITKNTGLSRNLEVNPGDTVEFRLVALSTGEGAASGVKIADSLPGAFEYIAGTTKIDGSFAVDGIVGGGISLGNLERNSSRVIVFSAKVSESYEYSIGENYFQNIGKLSASNITAMTGYLDVKVTREAVSDSKMSVGARLATSAQFFYSRSLSASPSQQVEFAVKITATGEADLNNAVLKSNFPSRLTYVKGSSSIDDQKVDDSITSGLNIGNIPLGSYKIVTFHALISGSSSFNYGNTPLVNELVMTANGVDATVREVTVNVNRYSPQAIPSPSLELMAYNETQGQDAATVLAKPGDIIWLVMLAKNNYATAISNYEIKNDINELLKVSSVTSTGGGTLTVGQLTYPTSIIPPESTISKELKIKINESEKWNDILQVSNTFGNTAMINLEKTVIIPEPKIEVIKRIINSTWANGTEVSVEARPNDQLEFIVEVTNTSPVMVGDVKVVENLPPKLTYVSGDASASYNSLTGEVLWELGALIPGEKKELRLLASVSSDAFIPSEFSLTSRAEASNGINNLSFDSNEVKAGVSGFLNPYSNWIKIIGGAVALILLVIFGYILYKRFIKKRDTNEYLPLGKN
jgi:uncharacterized repeat protein (TIGR01451 family)